MITGSKIRLRDQIIDDASDNYAWQTDAELVQFDAASLLTITFEQYLSEYTSVLRYPSSTGYRFAIETLDGKHIGNCSYYNIDKMRGEAELGILIGNRDYWGKGYGTDAVTTLVSHIFRQTNLKRIHLKTLESNTRAQKCFEKCGFTPYGHRDRDGYSFVLMEILRQQWQKKQVETES